MSTLNKYNLIISVLSIENNLFIFKNYPRVFVYFMKLCQLRCYITLLSVVKNKLKYYETIY